MGDRLEGADRLAELLALFRVGRSEIDHGARAAARARSRHDALDLQARQHEVEAFVEPRFAADEPVGRHAHVFQENLVSAGAAAAEHVELPHLDAGRVLVDEEERHALAVMRLGSVFT